MQHLAVTPSEVFFDVLHSGQQLTLPVCIKNLDARPRSFRVKPPSTRWFSLNGIGHTQRLAPGLSITFEVVFNGNLLDAPVSEEHHDTIKIASESSSAVQGPPLEIWLHALPPKPQLHVHGSLQFGVVLAGTKATKQLQLVNNGSASAEYKVTWDKALPLSVEPCMGILGAAGSLNSNTSISVTLAAAEPGAVVAELAISAPGVKEPLLCPLGASVAQASYQLIDDSTKAPVSEVDFGALYFGEAASRSLTLVNNSPTEACFDLSFGSVSELKALAPVSDDEGPAADDRLTAFLQVARIRAKSREDKGTMLRVSPVSGVIPAYSSTQLSVTFKPFAQGEQGVRGFRAQPLSPQQQMHAFDGLMQVNIAGGKSLRLPVKGCGLACTMNVQPDVLHFGIVPTYQWADQLVQLSNGCSQLPMQLQVVASGPYFCSLPAQLQLPPGGNSEVVLRYRPKALGHHETMICVQVISQRSPGRVLFESPVRALGSSLSLGPKQPLPGGTHATPETFILPRALVSEDEAAIAHLVAQKTYKRPQLWETAENADRLLGIGAQDRFGVTMDVHQERAMHADQYTAFIRAGRIAAARKHLTQPEGGDKDVNLGMLPYRGLRPPLLRIKQQVDPLWTVSQHAESAPVAQRLPPAAVLAAIPTYKEWLDTAQERTACSTALSPDQLSSLTVAPRQLDFGKLSLASPGIQQFVVTNPLGSPLHVVLNLSAVEGLSCSGPCSQVLPAGATGKFTLQLHCHDTQHIKENIQYVINGCHFQPLLVVADVVPVTLDVSEEELLFTFSLDNWDDHVEQALMLDNPHSFPVDYEWNLSSPVFAVSPACGTIKPRCSTQVLVRWTPGAAGCASSSKAAPKQLQDQPRTGGADGIVAAGSGSAAGAASSKLSKSGSSRAGAVASSTGMAAGSRSSSRPLSKESGIRTAVGSSAVAAAVKEGAAQPAVASRMPSEAGAGAAAAIGSREHVPAGASGKASSIPQNSSSITVELPADAATPAVAAATSVGCQHTGFMTLKLRGGGDAPPKKVMLYGELPASLLKFAAKEANLGPLPLFEKQTAVVQLKNAGSTDAAFRVLPSSQLSVAAERGTVVAESSFDLEVALLLTQPGPMHAVLELDLRGSKVIKLPFRAEGVSPLVHVAEPLLQFPSTFLGATSQLPLMLVNTTPVAATLLCDLMQLPEFELHLSRDAWAAAGYAACPVKRIGANGEMSAVGSMRGSRRATTHGMRTAGGNSSSGCGYKYLITLQPSSTLPLQMVFRPSTAQQQQFCLPLALQHSYAASSQDTAPAADAGHGHAVATPGRAAAASTAAQRRSTGDRRTSVSSSAQPKPGSATGSAKAAAATATAAAAAAAVEHPKLAVPVHATSAVPKVILSKTALDFGTKVARRALQGGKSPHVFDVHIRNNTDGPLQVAVGAPAVAGALSHLCSGPASSRANTGSKLDSSSSDAFTVEGWDTKLSAPFVSLGADEQLSFSVRFSPTEARVYEASVPLYLDGCRAEPYMRVQLQGTGTLPCLTFDAAECVLPMVPLGVTSMVRVYAVNDGYDNLEVTVRLPPDSSRLPVSVSFPEGQLIGLAKERLPLDISCCSSKPLSFTTTVDLLDEDGRAFSLVVTGSTDNCSLSHAPFMQLNIGKLLFGAPVAAGYPVPLRLLNTPSYELPIDEAVGPLHLTQGVCRFLSSMTSGSWGKTACSSSKSGAAVDEFSSSPVSEADAAGVLRQWLLNSKGKGLLELVEVLGGKPVSLKGAAAGKAASGGGKPSPVQQLLAVLEAALNHLRSHGALLNHVKPEYLLSEPDFQQLMEDRAAAAAGNSTLEDALDYWAAVETGFGAYSAMAWNSVLLQMLKIYALARVTPTALRQLLTSMGIPCASPAASPLEPVSNAASAAPSAAKAGTKPGSAQATTAAVQQAAPSPAAGPSSVPGAAAAVYEPGSVPPDEVLAGSNIYSTAEACLLTWLSVHAARAFPKLGLQVTNFGPDLRDGLVLGALLAAHWPGDSMSQMLSRLHTRPTSARHLRENQEMVVQALRELCLPYELSAADLDEAEPQAMLLLVTYLFTALPQLLPRATLDFSCKLGDQQVREIQLSNPTRRPLNYTARLEGAPDFALEASLVKIDPGQSIQVPVRFTPRTSLAKTSRLVLMSRRDNTAASAATLVFLLKGQADTSVPLKQVTVSTPLYQMAVQDFSLANPFPVDCDFSISIVPWPEQKPRKDEAKVKKDARPAAGPPKAPNSSAGVGSQQGRDVAKLFPEAFGLDRHRLRLKAGASEKLKLSFLPFTLPVSRQQAATQHATGRKSAKRASNAQDPPPVMRALLVLKDSECGEFVYELAGEVGQPATFLQHEAKVGLDGQQTVELQLPFTNHLLEGARRSYAEKHPLGRDKEQLCRMRGDIGTCNDRGERVLEYTVSCDSPLYNVPATFTLKGNAPAASFQDPTAASSPAVTSRVGSATRAQRAAPHAADGQQTQQQQQQAAPVSSAKDAVCNVLKLGLKPAGPGIHPTRLVLTSVYDVRIIELQVTAQARGQACVLEMECPARQQVVQELPLLNATSEAPLTATATLSGRGFSGPREVTVAAKAEGCYPLTFQPPGSGNFSGSLELLVSTTGEKLVYSLVGKASEPLVEGHVLVECQARATITKRLQVPNITGSLPLQYNVFADADWLSGPATLSCASANRGDTYKLAVCPLTSGTHWGSITFMAPDGQYCWFSVEVRATEPPEEGTITACCPVHQALAIQVSLVNPTDRPLQLRAAYGCSALLGPDTFTAAARPGTEATFECFYAPLVQGPQAGVLRLISREAGEFWWKLALEATPPLPQPPISLSAALGGTASTTLSLVNPTGAEATFSSSSTCPGRFWLEPQTIKVAANSVADVQLCYRPGRYQEQEHGTVSVTSTTAGDYEYVCQGVGEAPTGIQASSSINAMLGAACSSTDLAFTSPFDTPLEVDVSLSSTDEPGTFTLMVPGAYNPQASPTNTTQDGSSDADVAWASIACDDDENASNDGGDSSSNGAVKAAQLLGAVAAAALADEQQQQHKQPVVQQVARVLLAPGAVLQLPVTFAPRVLRKAAAQVSVAVVQPVTVSPGGPEQTAAAAERPRLMALAGALAPPAGPSGAASSAAASLLVWHYAVAGVARAETPGVTFAVKCVAKQRVEEQLDVPLPGLDVEQAAAGAAAAAAASAATAPPTGAGVSGGLGGFRYQLLLPEEHRAALAAAVSLEQLDAVPRLSPAAAASQSPCSGAGCTAPVLRFKLCFAPQKALVATAKLMVQCGEGGACWVYDVNFTAAAPDVAGVLTLEAHLGCTAELPLYLTASGPEPQPFTAEFSPESPLNFDVQPCRGLLPPAQEAAEPGGDAAAAAAALRTGGGQAPLRVTFLCKEMGKVVTGKLVVVTPDRQETFLVKGRQPAYTPPQAAALPSGTFLTATTASSRAKTGGSTHATAQHAARHAASNTGSSGFRSSGASGSETAGADQQRPQAPVNYLQRNIQAARSGAANSSRSPKSKADRGRL